MSYDSTYGKEYYQKHRENLIQATRKWQAVHRDRHIRSGKRYRKLHKDRENELWRKRYHEKKKVFEKEYGIMARNIRNERVQLYLSDPAYYKEKLQGKIKPEQLEIAYYYLDDPAHTLFSTGRQFHISKERVRQVCYKVLYKIWKMKPREKHMTEEIKLSGRRRPKIALTQEEFDRAKELFYQGETINDAAKEMHRSKFVILRIFHANDLQDYFTKQKAYYMKGKPVRASEPEVPQGTPVVFHGSVSDSPSPHRQALADAIDAFIKEEVRIQMKEKIQRLLGE